MTKDQIERQKAAARVAARRYLAGTGAAIRVSDPEAADEPEDPPGEGPDEGPPGEGAEGPPDGNEGGA